MKKEEFIKRILELDEWKFNKFMSISEQVLDLLDTGYKINTLINKIPISEKLKNTRKERGLTQVELAKELNLSKGQIGDIVDFNMDYGCSLRAMTSPYVKKYYVD